MNRAFLIPFCGLLLAMGAFSCDIMLPAFWPIQRDLGVSIERVQAVIPIFLFCSAFGQLLFGPASDRFGRRPVIVVGLACYLAGTGLAFSASSIEAMYAGRVLQGIGSACGVVVGRAILRDLHAGPALARALALAMAIFAFGPIAAPLIGYGLVSVGEWRAVFAGMTAFGATLMMGALLGLKETNPTPDPTALAPARLAASIRRVFAHPQSRFFVLLSAVNAFAILLFVINSPIIFKTAFGLEGLAFALMFATTGLGIVAGQLVNHRLIARLGVLAAMRAGSIVLLTAATLIVVLTQLDLLTVARFTCIMFAFNSSFLIVLSNAASLVIDPHREIAGFASSIFGFTSQSISSALGLVTIPVIDGVMARWAIAMLLVTATIFLALIAYRPVRAHVGEARQP